LKAVILAGGFATRLRPLSCSRPKMLFPVANQAIIDYTLRSMAQGGVDTVILSVCYMADILVRHLGSSRHGLSILYSREQKPLGTGGAIKYAHDFISDEPFFAMNGDTLTDLDYIRLHDYHEVKGGLATIALTQVPDPSRYGAVELDQQSHILRFVEKPPRGCEPSKLINAGVYVLEPEVLEMIPEGKHVSLETEVFPRLAEERKLYGFPSQGFWIDIGVPEDYLKANAMLLSRRDASEGPASAKINPSAVIAEPCVFGDGVIIGAGSIIGPNVSLSDGVHVGEGCVIENSIIFPDAVVEDHSSVKDAIVGESAVLSPRVKVGTGSLIGDYAQIRDGVTIAEHVYICPGKTVKESILEPRQVIM
jgi:NDP-sugar pyrophosphorylase family protein